MATRAERRAYARKLREISRNFDRVERETLQQSIRLLRDVRDRVAGQLTGTDFSAFRVAEQQQALDDIIAAYEQQARALTNGAVRQSFTLGELSAVEPLQAAGIEGAFLRPSETQVNILSQFSADLIGGVSDAMRGKMNRVIRMNALAGNSSLDAMREITQLLFKSDRPPSPRTRRPTKGVAYEAERILRTEVNRSYNLAAFSQQEQLAANVPGMRKQWVSTGDGRTRDSHLAIHGEVRPTEKQFSNGLMYPGDPRGAPEETINCRCRSVSVIPEVEDLALANDEQIAAELAKRGEKKPGTVARVKDKPAQTATGSPRFDSYDDARKWAEQNANLTQEQRDAIRLYTGDDREYGYKQINGALYTEIDGEQLIELQPDLKRHVNVLSDAVNQMPRYDGTTYRGVNFGAFGEQNMQSMIDDFARAQELGEPVNMPAFTSTSTSERTAKRYTNKQRGVFMEIRGTDGRAIASESAHKREKEVLFNRDSKFSVLSVGKDKGGFMRVVLGQA